MTKTNYLLRYFLLIALVAISLQTQAQVKYALKVGLNMSEIKHTRRSFNAYNYPAQKQVGYHVGVTVDWMLKDKFGLQTGFMFNRKGYNVD